MPRARTIKTMPTAAAPKEAGGCFMLPIVAALFVSAVLGTIAWNQPIGIQNADSPRPRPSVSPIFTREIQYWSASIIKWAAASNLDPNLVAVIMQIESCGDPRVNSSAGAMGLFQVMPYHFKFLDDPYDPDTNAARGLEYLSRSLAHANGNARLALAGYNGGIGMIDRAERSWPAQTKRYVQYGFPIYEDARNGAASSAGLDEWYEKFGESMCRQARERLGIP